jgi:FAD synthetase
LTRVLATGTFDLLHPGHLLYLERSKELGDELVVIVARDVNVKHKPKPIVPEEQRLKMVRALRIVDLAILGDEEDIFLPIEQLNPDIITLGFDQHFDPAKLGEEMVRRNLHPKVIRVTTQDSCCLCSSRKIVARVLEIHKIR